MMSIVIALVDFVGSVLLDRVLRGSLLMLMMMLMLMIESLVH